MPSTDGILLFPTVGYHIENLSESGDGVGGGGAGGVGGGENWACENPSSLSSHTLPSAVHLMFSSLPSLSNTFQAS